MRTKKTEPTKQPQEKEGITGRRPKVPNLEVIYNQLTNLSSKYSDYIESESLTEELNCLESWIESYLNGSPEAAAQLQQHGYDTIVHIKEALQQAAADIQRMDEESPNNAENFSGGRAHRLNKAATIAAKIETMMQRLENKPDHTHQRKPSCTLP